MTRRVVSLICMIPMIGIKIVCAENNLQIALVTKLLITYVDIACSIVLVDRQLSILTNSANGNINAPVQTVFLHFPTISGSDITVSNACLPNVRNDNNHK